MSYGNLCNVIVKNKAAGNALAAKIDPDSGGGQTFDNAVLCYPAGTTFTYDRRPQAMTYTASNQPVAWAVQTPMTDNGRDKVNEFNASGPWPLLNASGVTDQEVGALKPIVTCEVGLRETMRSLAEFIAANGYVTP